MSESEIKESSQIMSKFSYLSMLGFLALSLLLISITSEKLSTIINFLAKEGGLFENLTFVALLLTSLLFVKSSLVPRSSCLLNTLLSFLFFIFAMEEISWGQPIFNFSTPDFFEKFNYQREFNFHNLIPYQVFNGALFQSIYIFGILPPLCKGCKYKVSPPFTAHTLFLFSATLQIYESSLYGGKEKIEVFECFFLIVLFLLVHKVRHWPYSILFLFSFFFFWVNNELWNTKIYEIREFYISFGILLWVKHYLKNQKQTQMEKSLPFSS